MSEIESIYSAYRSTGIVSTDTRQLPDGCLFFALKGPNFNANEFAEKALDDGAAHAVIDDANIYEKSERKDRLFLVDDTLKTLQELAKVRRSKLDIPVIGIGGSNGKTTTKELLLRALAKKFKTQATRGNLNNHIGVPLSLLEIQDDTEIAIIELGTNQPGDIEELVEMAQPTSGVITNIGKEHLEGFGSMEGVAQEESHLFLYLMKHDGYAFINADDPWLSNMSKRIPNSTSFGWNTPADIQGILIHSYPYLDFKVDGYPVESKVPGAFNLSNMLAAWTIGKYYGVEPELMIEALADYQPDNRRSQWLEASGYRFLLDCYNANPSSMEVALRSLAGDADESLVILGDMLELGKFEAEEHQALVDLTAELGFKDVILIGPALKHTNTAFRKFDTPDDAQLFLKEESPKPGTLIFLKGSRGIGVERAVSHLTK